MVYNDHIGREQIYLPAWPISTGWWLGHPSEKYDFVNWDDDRNPIFLGKSNPWQPFTTKQSTNLSIKSGKFDPHLSVGSPTTSSDAHRPLGFGHFWFDMSSDSLAFYLSFWHSIWQSFCHSISFFWHLMWQFIWHSIWQSFWHSMWHSLWHLVWKQIWHSVNRLHRTETSKNKIEGLDLNMDKNKLQRVWPVRVRCIVSPR